MGGCKAGDHGAGGHVAVCCVAGGCRAGGPGVGGHGADIHRAGGRGGECRGAGGHRAGGRGVGCHGEGGCRAGGHKAVLAREAAEEETDLDSESGLVSSVEDLTENNTANDYNNGVGAEEENKLDDGRHWRNMDYDQEIKGFFYSNKGGTEVDINDTPAVTNWKKTRQYKMKRVHVTFDKGRHTMVAVIRTEYDNLEYCLDELGIENNSEGLIEYLFGKRVGLSRL